MYVCKPLLIKSSFRCETLRSIYELHTYMYGSCFCLACMPLTLAALAWMGRYYILRGFAFVKLTDNAPVSVEGGSDESFSLRLRLRVLA